MLPMWGPDQSHKKTTSFHDKHPLNQGPTITYVLLHVEYNITWAVVAGKIVLYFSARNHPISPATNSQIYEKRQNVPSAKNHFYIRINPCHLHTKYHKVFLNLLISREANAVLTPHKGSDICSPHIQV